MAARGEHMILRCFEAMRSVPFSLFPRISWAMWRCTSTLPMLAASRTSCDEPTGACQCVLGRKHSLFLVRCCMRLLDE